MKPEVKKADVPEHQAHRAVRRMAAQEAVARRR